MINGYQWTQMVYQWLAANDEGTVRPCFAIWNRRCARNMKKNDQHTWNLCRDRDTNPSTPCALRTSLLFKHVQNAVSYFIILIRNTLPNTSPSLECMGRLVLLLLGIFVDNWQVASWKARAQLLVDHSLDFLIVLAHRFPAQNRRSSGNIRVFLIQFTSL